MIWEVATGVCVATLEGHEAEVKSLALLDGGRLASGSCDRTIKIWDPATGECVATHEVHEDVHEGATGERVATLETVKQISLIALPGGRLAASSSGY